VREERVRDAEEVVGTLEVEGQPPDDSDEVGPEQGAPGAPLGEDDQADSDPAEAAGGRGREPAWGHGKADGRSGKSGERSTDEGIEIAHSVDVDAQRVGAA